jgi:hypothetical protein
MTDVDTWVQTASTELMFVYGQWDPWSAGMFRLGGDPDSALYVNAMGTHDSEFHDLVSADRNAAYARIAAWSGGAIGGTSARVVPQPRIRRIPPAVRAHLRLMRAR